jgi:hypothetical protein
MKRGNRNNPLVGTWRSAAAFGSSIEYQVAKRKTGYSVVARDTADGEVADIFEQSWSPKKGVLSFAAYWNASGRFTRCRLQLITAEQVELTYTYTDIDVLVRSRKNA